MAKMIEPEDGTVKVMRALGMPEDREHYIKAMFGGTPPEEGLGPELENLIPERFRKKQPTRRGGATPNQAL